MRYLWLHAYQGETRTVEEASKLRIHLRSNLDVPDQFTNETALEKIVLDVVLPWLGLYIVSADCGTYGQMDSVDHMRLESIKVHD